MSVVVVTELEHVAYVKLHRPDVRNAFNPEMIASLTKNFRELNQRNDLCAVALVGEGSVFCAGADLNWMKSMVDFSFEENQRDSALLFEMFESIMNCKLPVVTVVQGSAFGGALGLVACSDYVIAEDSASFCFSEVKLGLAPAVISAFVAKKANLGLVRPLMLSAKVFDSTQAMQIGLVHEVVATNQGNGALTKALALFKEAGPEAVRETKSMLNKMMQLDFNQQKLLTTKVISERRVSPEGQEGLRSFLQKRKPSWRL